MGAQVAREDRLALGTRLVFVDMKLIKVSIYETTITDYKTKRDKTATVYRHHFTHAIGDIVYSGQNLALVEGEFHHIKATVKRFEYIRGKRYVRLSRPFLLPNNALSFTDF